MAESKIDEEDFKQRGGRLQWSISNIPAKRRKSTPQKHSATPTTNKKQRKLCTEDNQQESYLDFTEAKTEYENGFKELGGGWFTPHHERQEDGNGEELERLREELEWYKKENTELRNMLATSLNVTELEKTLRMTLQTFGVTTPHSIAVPESISSTGDQVTSPKQNGQSSTSAIGDYKWMAETDDSCRYHTEEQPLEGSRYTETSQRYNVCNRLPTTTANGIMQGSPTDATQEILEPMPEIELLPGSEIFVEAGKIATLETKKGWSYTLLTRCLMPMVFTKDEMARCCVRGERATGNGALTSPARPALDQTKVQAIISFVNSKFPKTLLYQITQTMNQKLVDIRGTIQKRRQSSTKQTRQRRKKPTKTAKKLEISEEPLRSADSQPNRPDRSVKNPPRR